MYLGKPMDTVAPVEHRVLTKQAIMENRAFTKAVRKLFLFASQETCVRYGDLSQYMYASPDTHVRDDLVNGDAGFNDLLHHPDYYLLHKGKDLIADKQLEIARALGRTPGQMCDLGPGPRASVEGKTLPFIEAKTMMVGRENVSGVVLVDRSRSYLTSGQDAIHEVYPNMPITIINDTFDNIGDRLAHLNDVTITLLGNTGSNFPYNPIVPNPGSLAFFESIKDLASSSGGTVVIEQDCTQDENVLMAAYNNEAAAKWMKNLLHRMVRDANVVFERVDGSDKDKTDLRGGLDKDVSGFEYFARWNKDTFCMEMGVIASHDYTVRMNGESFNIKAGTELHMWNSHKYPIDLFKRMLETAGFKVSTVITDGDIYAKRPAQSALHFAHVDKLVA